MENNQNGNENLGLGGNPISEFGLTTDIVATGDARFIGGIHQGVLTKVEWGEFTKANKDTYKALKLSFSDLDNKRKFQKMEFIPTAGDNYDKNKEGLNKRMKHIIETYTGIENFPKNGIGKEAKNWDEYMQALATYMNTGREGKPIFKTKEDKFIPVHLKLTYYKNNLGFPLSPNFIEIVSLNKPTTLTIDKNYDKIVQDDPSTNNLFPGGGNIMGGTAGNDFLD